MSVAEHDAQTVARHVLWYFEVPGGFRPGSFVLALVNAIAAADVSNRARLAIGFPHYVAAVDLADRTLDGIASLQRIAAGEGV